MSRKDAERDNNSVCGYHGFLDSTRGECVCYTDTGEPWTGTYCQTPPKDTVPCTVSNADFRKAHGDGDLSCGNYGQFGVCNNNGKCNCGYTHPFSGTRCEKPATTHQGCGAVPCNDRTQDCTNPIGMLNPENNRCECKRKGWSGPQCRDVDEALADECTQDIDCGWGAEYSSASVCSKGADSSRCVCATDSAGNPLFTGKFCQNMAPRVNAICSDDTQCLKTQKCDKATHMCAGGDAADPSDPGLLLDFANMLSSMFLTEEGLEQLALFHSVGMATDALKKYLAEPVFAAYMKNEALAQGEKYFASDAFKALSSKLPASMISDVVANTATDAVVEKTVTMATDIAAKEAVASLFKLPFGEFFNVLMFVGMAIDMKDPAGLNTQMYQATIDAIMQMYVDSINNSQSLIDAGMSFPLLYGPENTVPFRLLYKSDDSFAKMNQYTIDYLDKLTINSDGKLIVPLFTSPSALALENDKDKYKALWWMSKGNDATFVRLKKHGWVLWLFLVLLVLLLVFWFVYNIKKGRNQS